MTLTMFDHDCYACRWEGPDHDGYLWLMIDNHEAVLASRTQGAELVARALISNVSACKCLPLA